MNGFAGFALGLVTGLVLGAIGVVWLAAAV